MGAMKRVLKQTWFGSEEVYCSAIVLGQSQVTAAAVLSYAFILGLSRTKDKTAEVGYET